MQPERITYKNCIKNTRAYQKKGETKKIMKPRMGKTDYYLNIADAISKRSNCLRRIYGCVIVKNDEIIATGYNGSPRGKKNCSDVREVCPRLDKPHNSNDYSNCESVHAEQNAIISASRQEMIGADMYLIGREYETSELIEDTEPCPICKRMIINAGIKRIITKNKICML